MIVQLTSNFYSDDAIRVAYKETNSPTGFLTVWSSLAKRVLQSGTPMLKKPELNKVSLLVETDANDSPAFKAMMKQGMIKFADEAELPSTVSEAQYEEWYKSYPYRDRGGKKVKIRGKSKVRFFNEIRNDEDFQKLMVATAEYSRLCNKLPKDPERFLKDGFWKEYLPSALPDSKPSVASSQNSTEVVTATDLDAMLNN